MQQTNLYRKDINGLRAIALLSVVIFHIFPILLPGGYLGVDMFFVISGYLITNILIKEYDNNNKISLINFYKRRILRIAPATLFTILLSLILGIFLLTNLHFKDLLKSSLFASFGFANVYFFKYLDTSYFAQDSSLNILLHLWSLGVEEQFYLIFPLFFIIFIKHKRILIISLIIFLLHQLV